MKTIKIIIAIFITIINISCDSNEDNNPATVCNSKFVTFATQKTFPLAADKFRIYQYEKSGTLNLASAADLTPSGNAFQASDYLYDDTTLYNPTSNELICHLPTLDRLLKFNKTSGVVTNTAIVGLSKPFYMNGNLKFLKFTNFTNTLSATSLQNFISHYEVQVTDENGVSSSSVFPINFVESDGIQIENSGAFFNSNKVIFLSGCTLIILDLTANTAQKKNLYSYDYNTNRFSTRGLKIKDNNTLVFAKLEILPTFNLKIEKIDVTSLLASTTASYVTQPIFNFNSASFAGAGTTLFNLGLMINRIDFSAFAFDKCDDNYYITTYEQNLSNPLLNDAFLLELKPNTNKFNYYGIASGSDIFGLEIVQ